MKKRKSKELNMQIFTPEEFSDIENIVENLLEKETSILVNFSKQKIKKESITKIMNYILEAQTSYMLIKVKKVFPKVFICWSIQNEMYV